MRTYYSIGETAKRSSTTIETLRHYDRIGLLKPAKVDVHTGYRYYSDEELVYLNVINFCKQRSMPLNDIKELFANDHYEYIIPCLIATEDKIDQEIKQLQHTKKLLLALREQYETRTTLIPEQLSDHIFSSKMIPKRMILTFPSIQQPSIENFQQLQDLLLQYSSDGEGGSFIFEHSAFILTTLEKEQSENHSVLFGVCEKWPAEAENMAALPAGTYIYGYCSEEQKPLAMQNMINDAKTKYDAELAFIVQSVIFTGIFQWVYELQALLVPYSE